MKIKAKRFLGIFLSFALMLGLMPWMSLTVKAADTEDVSYIDENGTVQTHNNCELFTSETDWSSTRSKWYVVEGNVTNSNFPNVYADKYFILKDGATLTLTHDSRRVNIDNNCSLVIYGQEAQSGTFNYISTCLRSDSITSTSTCLKIYGGKFNVTSSGGMNAGLEVGSIIVKRGKLTVASGSINGIKTYSSEGLSVSDGGEVVATCPSTKKAIIGNITLGNGQYLYEGADSDSAVWTEVANTTRPVYMRINNISPHTHSFTYTVGTGESANTITAECANTDELCGLTENKITLTLVKPTKTSYGDSGDAAATLSGLSAFNTATGKSISISDIVYVGRDGTAYTEQSTAPSDVGKYTAKITVDDLTAIVDYEIGKAKETAPTNAEAAKEKLNIDYFSEAIGVAEGYELSSAEGDTATAITNFSEILNQTAPTVYVRKSATDDNHAPSDWVAVTLPARPNAPTNLSAVSATTATSADGKINGTTSSMEYSADNGTTWTVASGDATLVKAGTYLVRYMAQPNAPASNTVTVTVPSKQIVLSDDQKPTQKTGLTYTGEAQPLLNAPIANLPEYVECIWYAKSSSNETPPVVWDPVIPAATEAGIYYVWYYAEAKEGATRTNSDYECVPVTIAKASSQSAIVNPLDRIYDGTEQPLVTVNQASLQNKLMTLRRTLTPSIIEEFIEEEQDTNSDTNNETQKSDATDDTENSDAEDTQDKGDESEEATENTQDATVSEQTENDNDEEGEQKDSELNEEKIIKNSMLIKEILTPADVDTEDDQQEENDDKEVEEKADKDVESEETTEETKEESVDEKSDEESETTSSEESTQESDTTKEETQEESTAATEAKDEKPVVLKAMRTVRLLGTTPTEDPSLKFALGSNSQVEPSDGWSADIPKKRNAGTYYVWYKVEGDANHYGTAAACTTVTISKATATVIAKDQTITVGDTVPTLDSSDLYTVSGLVGDDGLIKAPTLTYQKNGESVVPDNTKADSYDIVPSGASAGENYNITYVKGTLKVSESASAVVEIVPSEEPTSIIAKDPEISNGLAAQAEEMAKEGDKVELKLVVAPKGESNIAESEALNQAPQMKLQVESQFKEEDTVKVDVVDIDIKQIINGATQENLKETNAVLEIAIGYDFTGKYDPVVIREHEGNAKAFKALDARPSANYEDGTFFADVENNMIYLYSRYFSTYVIAYSTVEGNATNREPVITTSSGGEVSEPGVRTVPVYRLFNLQKGYHFFTANAAEKDALVAAGWTDEGVAWQVRPNVGAPVYRLFDKTKGMHIFTVDIAERDACIAAGASDEGIAWYAPTNVGRTVYKITNPKVNRVLYTISAAEKDALAATGFTVEEAKFKAY